MREKEEDFWGKRALENFGQQLGAERERATSFGRKEAEFEVEATHERVLVRHPGTYLLAPWSLLMLVQILIRA